MFKHEANIEIMYAEALEQMKRRDFDRKGGDEGDVSSRVSENEVAIKSSEGFRLILESVLRFFQKNANNIRK